MTPLLSISGDASGVVWLSPVAMDPYLALSVDDWRFDLIVATRAGLAPENRGGFLKASASDDMVNSTRSRR